MILVLVTGTETRPSKNDADDDQSTCSSHESSQSYHSFPVVDVVSSSNSVSDSAADVDFESCVSSLSGYSSCISGRSSVGGSCESLETLGQSNIDSQGTSSSFHSIFSRAESSVTLRSESCDSVHSVQSEPPLPAPIPTLSSETIQDISSQNNNCPVTPDILDHTALPLFLGASLSQPSNSTEESSKQQSDRVDTARQPPGDQGIVEFVCEGNLHIAVSGNEDYGEVQATRVTEAETITQVEQSYEDNISPRSESASSLSVKCSSSEDDVRDTDTPVLTSTPVTGLSAIIMSSEGIVSDTLSVSSGGSISPQSDGEEKPVLARGRIAALRKSFDASQEPEAVPVMRRTGGPRRTSKSNTFDFTSQWENAERIEAPQRPVSQSSTSQRRSRLAEKLAMFNSTGSSPMEFGVHITTTKDLDTLTKQSKNIYVSNEERRRQQQKLQEEKESAKVTIQLSPLHYQSTVKVEPDQVSCIRRYDYDGSVSYESFDWSMDSEFDEELCAHDDNVCFKEKLYVDISEAPLSGQPAPDLVRGLEHYYLPPGGEVEADSIDLFESMSDSSSLSDRWREERRQTDDTTTEGGFTTADENILSSECEEDYLMAVPDSKSAVNTAEHWLNTDNKNPSDEYSEGSNPPTQNATEQSLTCRQDSTETYLAENTETFYTHSITNNQPGGPEEMSQAARISNFIENFARNSSESTDSSLTTPGAEAGPNAASTEFIDAVTLIVPKQTPRLAALSREGSVRSSFEIYKINEESGEEDIDNDSPRKRTSDKNRAAVTTDESNRANRAGEGESRSLTFASPENDDTLVNDLPTENDRNTSFIETWVQHLDTHSHQSSDLSGLHSDEICHDDDLYSPVEMQSAITLCASNKIIPNENTSNISVSPVDPHVMSVTDSLLSYSHEGEVDVPEVLPESDDVFDTISNPVDDLCCKPKYDPPTSLALTAMSPQDEGFHSYSEFAEDPANPINFGDDNQGIITVSHVSDIKSEADHAEILVRDSAQKSHEQTHVPSVFSDLYEKHIQEVSNTVAKQGDDILVHENSTTHDDSGYADVSAASMFQSESKPVTDLSTGSQNLTDNLADKWVEQNFSESKSQSGGNEESLSSLQSKHDIPSVIQPSETTQGCFGTVGENLHKSAQVTQCEYKMLEIEGCEAQSIIIGNENISVGCTPQGIDLHDMYQDVFCRDVLISFSDAQITQKNIPADETENIQADYTQDMNKTQMSPEYVTIPYSNSTKPVMINYTDCETGTNNEYSVNQIPACDGVDQAVGVRVSVTPEQCSVTSQPTVILSEACNAELVISNNLCVSVESLRSSVGEDNSSHDPHSLSSSSGERSTASYCESFDDHVDVHSTCEAAESMISCAVPVIFQATPDRIVSEISPSSSDNLINPDTASKISIVTTLEVNQISAEKTDHLSPVNPPIAHAQIDDVSESKVETNSLISGLPNNSFCQTMPLLVNLDSSQNKDKRTSVQIDGIVVSMVSENSDIGITPTYNMKQEIKTDSHIAELSHSDLCQSTGISTMDEVGGGHTTLPTACFVEFQSESVVDNQRTAVYANNDPISTSITQSHTVTPSVDNPVLSKISAHASSLPLFDGNLVRCETLDDNPNTAFPCRKTHLNTCEYKRADNACQASHVTSAKEYIGKMSTEILPCGPVTPETSPSVSTADDVDYSSLLESALVFCGSPSLSPVESLPTELIQHREDPTLTDSYVSDASECSDTVSIEVLNVKTFAGSEEERITPENKQKTPSLDKSPLLTKASCETDNRSPKEFYADLKLQLLQNALHMPTPSRLSPSPTLQPNLQPSDVTTDDLANMEIPPQQSMKTHSHTISDSFGSFEAVALLDQENGSRKQLHVTDSLPISESGIFPAPELTDFNAQPQCENHRSISSQSLDKLQTADELSVDEHTNHSVSQVEIKTIEFTDVAHVLANAVSEDICVDDNAENMNSVDYESPSPDTAKLPSQLVSNECLSETASTNDSSHSIESTISMSGNDELSVPEQEEQTPHIPSEISSLTSKEVTSQAALSSSGEKSEELLLTSLEKTTLLHSEVIPLRCMQRNTNVACDTDPIAIPEQRNTDNQEKADIVVTPEKTECDAFVHEPKMAAVGQSSKPADTLSPKEFYTDLKCQLIRDRFGSNSNNQISISESPSKPELSLNINKSKGEKFPVESVNFDCTKLSTPPDNGSERHLPPQNQDATFESRSLGDDLIHTKSAVPHFLTSSENVSVSSNTSSDDQAPCSAEFSSHFHFLSQGSNVYKDSSELDISRQADEASDTVQIDDDTKLEALECGSLEPLITNTGIHIDKSKPSAPQFITSFENVSVSSHTSSDDQVSHHEDLSSLVIFSDCHNTARKDFIERETSQEDIQIGENAGSQVCVQPLLESSVAACDMQSNEPSVNHAPDTLLENFVEPGIKIEADDSSDQFMVDKGNERELIQDLQNEDSKGETQEEQIKDRDIDTGELKPSAPQFLTSFENVSVSSHTSGDESVLCAEELSPPGMLTSEPPTAQHVILADNFPMQTENDDPHGDVPPVLELSPSTSSAFNASPAQHSTYLKSALEDRVFSGTKICVEAHSSVCSVADISDSTKPPESDAFNLLSRTEAGPQYVSSLKPVVVDSRSPKEFYADLKMSLLEDQFKVMNEELTCTYQRPNSVNDELDKGSSTSESYPEANPINEPVASTIENENTTHNDTQLSDYHTELTAPKFVISFKNVELGSTEHSIVLSESDSYDDQSVEDSVEKLSFFDERLPTDENFDHVENLPHPERCVSQGEFSAPQFVSSFQSVHMTSEESSDNDSDAASVIEVRVDNTSCNQTNETPEQTTNAIQVNDDEKVDSNKAYDSMQSTAHSKLQTQNNFSNLLAHPSSVDTDDLYPLQSPPTSGSDDAVTPYNESGDLPQAPVSKAMIVKQDSVDIEVHVDVNTETHRNHSDSSVMKVDSFELPPHEEKPLTENVQQQTDEDGQAAYPYHSHLHTSNIALISSQELKSAPDSAEVESDSNTSQLEVVPCPNNVAVIEKLRSDEFEEIAPSFTQSIPTIDSRSPRLFYADLKLSLLNLSPSSPSSPSATQATTAVEEPSDDITAEAELCESVLPLNTPVYSACVHPYTFLNILTSDLYP